VRASLDGHHSPKLFSILMIVFQKSLRELNIEE
jgi:hypothetical protein